MKKSDTIMDFYDLFYTTSNKPTTVKEAEDEYDRLKLLNAEREYKRLKKIKDAKYNEKYKELAKKQPIKIMDGLKGYTKKKRPDNK